MDKEEFRARFGPRASYVVLPCNCGEEECHGWQWRSRESLVADREDGIDDLDIMRGYYTSADVEAALAAPR